MATIQNLSTELLSELFLAVARVDSPSLHHFTGRVTAPGWFSITQVCHEWRIISLSLRTLWARAWTDVPSKMLEWVARAGEASLHVRTPFTTSASADSMARLPAVLIEHRLAMRVKSIYLKYNPARLQDWGSVQVNGISYPPKRLWSCIRLPQLEDAELHYAWLDGGFPGSALKSFTLHCTRAPVLALVDDILRPQKDSLERLVVRNGLIRTPGQGMETNRVPVGRPVALERMEDMDVSGTLHELALLILSVKLSQKIKTLALLFHRDYSSIYLDRFWDFARLVDSLRCVQGRCDVLRAKIARASVDQYFFELEAWFVDDVRPARERAKLPPNVSITFRGMEFDEFETSPLCPVEEMLQLWIDAMRCKDRTVDVIFLDISMWLYDDAPGAFDWGRLETMDVRWVVPYAARSVVGGCDHEEGWNPYNEGRILALEGTSVLFED